jgi:hypothetical protein
MNAEETSVIEQSALAEKNLDDILRAKYNVVANYLALGLLFKENRDGGLFKLLGYDSFEDFIGSPEVAFSRSKAYLLIHIRELYKDKLGIDDKTLLEIGNSKLALIAPVVESDKEGWLTKARELSKSDLRIELGREPGKQLSPPAPASAASSGCVVCGKGGTDNHHFPVTRGAGCPDNWTIPLCREHHTEYHNEPKDWIWENRRKWAAYFYERISGTE